MNGTNFILKTMLSTFPNEDVPGFFQPISWLKAAEVSTLGTTLLQHKQALSRTIAVTQKSHLCAGYSQVKVY